MNVFFSAPTSVNLELTEACNIKCRHCYNFWRQGDLGRISMTKEAVNQLIDMLVDAKVFHAILTGGEPFVRFDLLEFAAKKLIENNISISCNSNLMLATEDKIKRLRDVGLDHILTSLNSYDPATNDAMVCSPGAFEKIIAGIKTCIRNGIRISVNMIVSERNKHQVYQTGYLAHDLGCQMIFGTRIVPCVNLKKVSGTEFDLKKEDALNTLAQLVRVKQDTGIMIGTLVSYPLCLLGDLEKYQDFVGRGCPSQSGHRMSINATGESHPCVHEEESHGNVFKIGIREAYKNMRSWHNKSYYAKECIGCNYIEVCKTGCRMAAHSYFGRYDAPDNLMVGKNAIVKPYKIVQDPKIYEEIDRGLKFVAPKRLRFRKENGFYLLNIRWANVITVPSDVANFLMTKQASGEEFTINDFGIDKKELLARLYFKDAVESPYAFYKDSTKKVGLSVNPLDIK